MALDLKIQPIWDSIHTSTIRPLPEGGLFKVCTPVKFLGFSGFLGFSTLSVPGSSGETDEVQNSPQFLHNSLHMGSTLTWNIAQYTRTLRNTFGHFAILSKLNSYGSIFSDLGHCAIHLDIAQYTWALHNTFKIAVIRYDFRF